MRISKTTFLLAALVVAAAVLDVVTGVTPYFVLTAALLAVFGRRLLNPLSAFLLSWSLLFVNFWLGPLAYPLEVDDDTYFVILGFVGVCVVGFMLFSRVSLVPSGRDPLAGARGRTLAWIGLLGTLLLVLGGIQSTGTLLLQGQLLALRQTFLTDVNNFTRLGWFLFWPTLLVIFIAILRPGQLPRYLVWSSLLGVAVIPLLSAGRQLYLQVIVICLVALAIRHATRAQAGAGPRPKRRGLRPSILLGGVAGLMVMVSALRTDDTSREYFGDKLGVFANYSGVQLQDNYEGLMQMAPQGLSDFLVEYNYYYGAQLPRLSEALQIMDIPVAGFALFNKVPVIARNLERVVPLLVRRSNGTADVNLELKIASFTWATSIAGNLGLFGYVGLAFVGLAFGMASGFAYRLHRAAPQNLAAGNFLAANIVLAFYTTMFSPLQDTNFFLYYTASLIFAFRSVSLHSRVWKQEPAASLNQA